MNIDADRISELLEVVKRNSDEVPQLYAQRGEALSTEQAVFQKLMQSAKALTEARDLVFGDREMWVELEVARRYVMTRIVESAQTCIALENAALMAEAAQATKH